MSPFRSDVLRGAAVVKQSVSERLAPADLDAAVQTASKLLNEPADIKQALSYLLYPQVFTEYAKARQNYSNVLRVPTLTYFYGMEEGEEIEVDIEPGKRLFIKLIAVSDVAPNGERTVFYELNGQPRSINVRDKSVVAEVRENERADSANNNHVGAPLAGAIVGYSVAAGDKIEKDSPLFTVEAMKMQSVVRAAKPGKVKRQVVPIGGRVSVGDLIVELE